MKLNCGLWMGGGAAARGGFMPIRAAAGVLLLGKRPAGA